MWLFKINVFRKGYSMAPPYQRNTSSAELKKEHCTLSVQITKTMSIGQFMDFTLLLDIFLCCTIICVYCYKVI